MITMRGMEGPGHITLKMSKERKFKICIATVNTKELNP